MPRLPRVSGKECAGLQATRDEMSYPGWEMRLARAEKESAAGQGKALESWLADRAARP